MFKETFVLRQKYTQMNSEMCSGIAPLEIRRASAIAAMDHLKMGSIDIV